MRKPQSSEEIRWTLYFWLVVIILGGGTVVAAYYIAAAAVRMISQQLGLPM